MLTLLRDGIGAVSIPVMLGRVADAVDGKLGVARFCGERRVGGAESVGGAEVSVGGAGDRIGGWLEFEAVVEAMS